MTVTTKRTILISGVGIAGPALAFWLHRLGARAILVERAKELRHGGQAVDIRGPGRLVMARMGIEPEVRAAWTGERGVQFVDRRNRAWASFAAETLNGEGPTSEFEILRGDLAQILYDKTARTCEYRFGETVRAMADEGARVQVTLAGGDTLAVDAVVGADGMHSNVRHLLFGDGGHETFIGLYMAYFTIPREPQDTAWARWFNAPGGRVASLRPDRHGTTRVLLSFLSEPRGYDRLRSTEQRALLDEVFADITAWEVPRILRQMHETTDLYFDGVGQVHLPQWHRGCIALLGDAAYCPSPITGMGTTLALVGAYVMAHELAKPERNIAAAFAAYEATMRPLVKRAQKLPPGAPRLMHPSSRSGIAALHAALAVAARPRVSRLISKVVGPPGSQLTLPNYNLRRRPICATKSQ